MKNWTQNIIYYASVNDACRTVDKYWEMEYYISLFISTTCIYAGQAYGRFIQIHNHHITKYVQMYGPPKGTQTKKRRRKLHPILTLEVTLDKQIYTIEYMSMDITWPSSIYIYKHNISVSPYVYIWNENDTHTHTYSHSFTLCFQCKQKLILYQRYTKLLNVVRR